MKPLTPRVLDWLMAAAALVSLSGCATGYLLDNDVQSFSALPATPAEPTYRFERLPSQESPAQAQLEAMAMQALQGAGLRPEDASPRYSVQVGARTQPVLSPWASPWDGWGWGGGVGWGIGRHSFASMGLFGRMESPWYQREVSVVMRELPSNRVMFESHAVNEGPWLDNGSVFPAMFQAALQGFPNPPPGPRRVDIRIGGR